MDWVNFWWQSLFAAVGTVAFAVLYEVHPRHYLFCALVGGVGWQVFLLTRWQTGSPVFSSFLATVVLAALCRWFSTLRRTPTIVFLICGIFPLVPGSEIYYTAYYLFLKDSAQAARHGSLSLWLSVSIAMGILITYSLPDRFFGWKRPAQKP